MLPRIECGVYPTPLEEMTRLRQALGPGCPRLFIKRDDLTGTAFGSNKLRKLDYAIANEIERATEVIVTIGGEYSNHARVTAAVCARLGLKCVLVLNRVESSRMPGGMVPASRYVYESFGPEIRWVESREDRESAALDVVDAINASGRKAAFLPLGISYPLGALGFVKAVAEVEEQFKKFGTFPNHIFHASTSGGTQAGMIEGLSVVGQATKVVGISPDDRSSEIEERVASIIDGMSDYVGTMPIRGEVCVLDDFIGEGYGIPTEASRNALEIVARSEGIILDHTYTAKAFAALLDWIKKGELTADDTVLFWHTGGQLAHFFAPVK